MKYLGTISNSQDIITKGWLIKNVASVIPDGSITASKLAEDIETSAMVATEVKNPVLTKSGDTFIWTISATEHGLMSTALSVIVYDTNGKQVACDISVGNDYGITVSIYDNSTATSVSAEIYRAVIIGNGSPKTSDVSELVITELDKKQLRTDLLTLEESENTNTDNMVIPFYDTITGSNKKVALDSVLFGTSNLGANVVTRAKMAIDAFTLADNAGAHNAIYRGKNLGSAVTAAQWAAIDAGTFEDLFIGDYWTIGGGRRRFQSQHGDRHHHESRGRHHRADRGRRTAEQHRPGRQVVARTRTEVCGAEATRSHRQHLYGLADGFGRGL